MLGRAKLTTSIFLFSLSALTACSSASVPPPQPTGSDPPPAENANKPAENSGPKPSEPGKSPDEPEAPATPFQAFDVNHVLSTGQSNSVASGAGNVITHTQPYTNLMFDVGVMTSGGCDGTGCAWYEKPQGFLPLVEGDAFWYPVETMSAALANQATRLATTKYGKPGHDVLVSLHGRSQNTLFCLRKNGCPYQPAGYVKSFDEAMLQVGDALVLAAKANKTYVVRAVTAIHGESDHYAYGAGTQEFPMNGTNGVAGAIKNYGDGLVEWQKDYEGAIKEITQQTIPVPLFVSQMSNWTDRPFSEVAQYQLEAHAKSKGAVVLVAPGYAVEWANDCHHMTANGERQLGEYFAKAYARTVVEGKPWEPVRPKSVTIDGKIITAKFHVPTPPLVLDYERVMDPGNAGFEYRDDNGSAWIDNVKLVGPDTLQITLSAVPNGANKKIRYAFGMNNQAPGCPGRWTGARGNLRDSDATPSQTGYELFNWGVHFEAPVIGQ